MRSFPFRPGKTVEAKFEQEKNKQELLNSLLMDHYIRRGMKPNTGIRYGAISR